MHCSAVVPQFINLTHSTVLGRGPHSRSSPEVKPCSVLFFTNRSAPAPRYYRALFTKASACRTQMVIKQRFHRISLGPGAQAYSKVHGWSSVHFQ